MRNLCIHKKNLSILNNNDKQYLIIPRHARGLDRTLYVVKTTSHKTCLRSSCGTSSSRDKFLCTHSKVKHCLVRQKQNQVCTILCIFRTDNKISLMYIVPFYLYRTYFKIRLIITLHVKYFRWAITLNLKKL